MISHKKAIQSIDKLYGPEFITLYDYIKQQEKLQTEYEALKKDVARYVELDFFHIAPYRFKKKYANENKLIGETVKESISRLDNEWLTFIQKLKKVGNEE